MAARVVQEEQAALPGAPQAQVETAGLKLRGPRAVPAAPGRREAPGQSEPGPRERPAAVEVAAVHEAASEGRAAPED